MAPMVHHVKLAAAETMPPLFTLLAIMLVGVVLVSLLLLRFRQSLLLGYFLCGVAIANSGVLDHFGGGESEDTLRRMAEFGVVLLMFTVGVGFSLHEWRSLRRYALWAGTLQMALVTIPAAIVGVYWGLNWPSAITLAVAVAMSSTAVGMKVFDDRGMSNTPGARLALGIAIFQDLFVVGFLVFLPVLFSTGLMGSEDTVWTRMGTVAAKGIGFVAIAVVLSKWVIPRILHAVARSRSRELFTLAVFGLCIGVAFVGGALELSLALGAFVAGVTVSDSIYRHRILTDVMPFKDLFLTLFFVSGGLMVDVRAALANGHWVLMGTVGLMLFKALLVALIGRRMGVPARASLLGAASLSSAGEFSLILMNRAGALQAWPPAVEQVWLTSIALSMALVPAAMRSADLVADLAGRVRWWKRPAALPADMKASERVRALTDHAIVCGYGPVGRRLVEALDGEGVPVLVVDLNADTVRTLHRSGRAVLFADAGQRETWELARTRRARLAAFTFPDSSVAEAALPLIREFNREILILVRTKFSAEAERLRAMGFQIVVHDEAETAHAVVRETLAAYEHAKPPGIEATAG